MEWVPLIFLIIGVAGWLISRQHLFVVDNHYPKHRLIDAPPPYLPEAANPRETCAYCGTGLDRSVATCQSCGAENPLYRGKLFVDWKNQPRPAPPNYPPPIPYAQHFVRKTYPPNWVGDCDEWDEMRGDDMTIKVCMRIRNPDRVDHRLIGRERR